MALAKAKMRSLRYGSKAQRIAFEYFRKYFMINNDIKVYSNDHIPFIGCSKNYSIDMSIPKYKIAIELKLEPQFKLKHEMKISIGTNK